MSKPSRSLPYPDKLSYANLSEPSDCDYEETTQQATGAAVSVLRANGEEPSISSKPQAIP